MCGKKRVLRWKIDILFGYRSYLQLRNPLVDSPGPFTIQEGKRMRIAVQSIELWPSLCALLRFSRLRKALFLLAIPCFLAPGAHAQRADFPAAYTVTDVSLAENGVELTLTLTLRNYSGFDIDDCKVLVSSSGPYATAIGSFGRIKLLRSNREVSVRRRFTIPQDEYERWQMGMQPEFELRVSNGDGGAREERIEARREYPPVEAAE